MGRSGCGVLIVWTTNLNSDVLQLPQTHYHRDRRLLYRSHRQPAEVVEDLFLPFQDTWEGGVWPQNFRTFLPGDGSGHPSFWIGEVGYDPTYGPHPGYFLPQVIEKYFGDSNADVVGWDLGIPPSGRFPTGGGYGDNGGVHIHMPEYGSAVHWDTTYYWPVYVGGAEAWLAITQVFLVTGGSVFYRPKGGFRGRQGLGWYRWGGESVGGGWGGGMEVQSRAGRWGLICW